MVRNLLPVMACLILGACSEGAGRIDGPYLIEITDIPEDAVVCYELPQGDCIERVPQAVFAVGYNQDYVVVARHPHRFEDTTLDRSRPEYFYIVRSLDGPNASPEQSVRGPYDLAAFNRHKEQLGLPNPTREIAGLR